MDDLLSRADSLEEQMRARKLELQRFEIGFGLDQLSPRSKLIKASAGGSKQKLKAAKRQTAKYRRYD